MGAPLSSLWTTLSTLLTARRAPSHADDAKALDLAAQAVRDVLSAHAADVDSRGRFPAESIDALRENGLMGLCVPVEHGGGGAGRRACAAVAETLAQGCASTAMVWVMHTAAVRAIEASSVLHDRDELLRAIARGTHLTTLAFSEPGSRSQFWAPASQMTPMPGGYDVTARKAWVTAANHADSYVASGRPDAPVGPLDVTVYLIRRGQAIRPGGPFNGLGLRGNDSAPVAIEHAYVPDGDLVSSPGEGLHTMLRTVLPWFCAGTAGLANGLCRAAVAGTADHLQEAGYHGTSLKLRDHPQLRARLAEMEVRTEQSRALLARSVEHFEHSPDALLLFMLEARLAAVQAAVDVTDLAMKACGGAAFSRHLTIERLFRDARAGWVMAPTVDQLQDFIGKTLTGLPVF